jgi:hypothetical protein
MIGRMIAIGLLFLRMLCDCFKPRQRLEAEIATGPGATATALHDYYRVPLIGVHE